MSRIRLSIACATALSLLALGLPASAQQADLETRQLKAQITNLQDEVRRLTEMTLQMQLQLNAIANNLLSGNQVAVLGEETAITNCQNRLNSLQQKRDSLATFGFQAKHPDVVNVTRQMETIERECNELVANKSQ